jgi:hypothetical protein
MAPLWERKLHAQLIVGNQCRAGDTASALEEIVQAPKTKAAEPRSGRFAGSQIP